MVIIKKGGSIAGSIYGGRKACWNVKEKLAGDLEKIQYSKRQGRFNEALALANDSLKHLPNNPEALFLKAQILHEGFGQGESARKCLEIIIKEVPTSETLHHWALSLYEDITSKGEIGQDPALSGKD
jgi:tetratricopeptide (TPR) repeat protein